MDWVAETAETHFSVREAVMLKVKAPANSISGESPLPVHRWLTSLCVLVEILTPSTYNASNPVMRNSFIPSFNH